MATAFEQREIEGSLNRVEQLFRAHHDRVLRAAYRITGNMADAEDVAQAVFLRLAATNGAIDNPGSYLYRAAINGALDLLRRKTSMSEVGLELVCDVAGSSEHSPERQLSSRELGMRLRRAISTLSPRAAEMFVLRYIEDCDTAMIAKTLNTSRAVVAVTLHQSRAKLKKQFQLFK